MLAVIVHTFHPSRWEARATGFRVPGQAGQRDDSVWNEKEICVGKVFCMLPHSFPPSLLTHFPFFLNECGSVFVFHLNVVRKSLV